MSAELLINVTPRETRAAFVENGMLQELFVERASSRGIVGNVYLGRILRVLPGMQAAFVDIGLDRAAFLHASDISTSMLVLADEAVALPDGSANSDDTNSHGNGGSESITRLVYEGQELMVQVIKDPIGGKGARLTTHLSIPACFLVFLPDGDGGVSRRESTTQPIVTFGPK